jgi:hypothetical protein
MGDAGLWRRVGRDGGLGEGGCGDHKKQAEKSASRHEASHGR